MLSENIKVFRKSKGFSREELADKLNVVRQTVSKWEQGLSAPDAGLLIALSKALETPVSTLLGETAAESKAGGFNEIAERLEEINLQLAKKKTVRRMILHWLFVLWFLIAVTASAVFIGYGSFYLGWDYSDPETAVAGTILHGSEWMFVRLAPIMLIGAAVGIFLTRKKR